MLADPVSWLRDRFANLSGSLRVLEQVNLSEVSEALAAQKRAYLLTKDCDWGQHAEVGACIDSYFVAAKETADVSVTPVDDSIVDAVEAAYQPNREVIIGAIVWLASHADDDLPTGERIQAFAGARGYETAGEGGSVLTWIQLAVLIWELVKTYVRK
jgi:hypothetical protein